MLEVAFWAQNQSSFQAAEDTILKTLCLKINDDTVRYVANTVGQFVHERDLMEAEDCYSRLESGNLRLPKKKKAGTLYIETDGAAVNTRNKDDDGSSWRENKLGVVFSSDNIHSWFNKKGEPQHKILKREYVSFIGGVDEFKKQLFACAIRNGYGMYEETVILGDGASWIKSIKNELFPDARQIFDFYHLCENVYKFAKHAFKMEVSKYTPWAKMATDLLRKSKTDEVIAILDGFADNVLESAPVNLRRYIESNIGNIDYASYISKGYFIGSGAIESGNKTVLQNRLKQAGMRWNVATAQNILTLRAKRESQRWQKDVVEPILEKYNAFPNSLHHLSVASKMV